MFKRTPQSKSRPTGDSGHLSASKRKRDMLDSSSSLSALGEFSSPISATDRSSRSPHLASAPASPARGGQGSSSSGAPPRAHTTILRKVHALQPEENASLEAGGALRAVHLSPTGDLLLLREHSLTLHQDVLRSYHPAAISIPLSSSSGDGPVAVDVLSLQHGQRSEVVALSSGNAAPSLQLAVVDGDGHVAHGKGAVRLARATEESGQPVVSCMTHTAGGVLLVGTRDEQVYALRHVVLSSGGSADAHAMAIQSHLLQQQKATGFMGLLQSGKRLLSIFGSGSGSGGNEGDEGAPGATSAIEKRPVTRHGGRAAVCWYGDETLSWPMLRVLTVGEGRVLAVGAHVRLWSGVGEAGREELEWSFNLHREAFNAANGREVGDEGGYEGHCGVCVVDALLLPLENGARRACLLVLAASSEHAGDCGSATGSPAHNSAGESEVWLLVIDVPLVPGEASGQDCGLRYRQQLTETAHLGGGVLAYVPTIHSVPSAGGELGSDRVLVSWVSTTKARTLHVAVVPVSSSASLSPATLAVHDSGIAGHDVVTTAHMEHTDGLVVLREDGALVHVLLGGAGGNGAHLGRTSPRPGSPRADMFDSLLARRSRPQPQRVGNASPLQIPDKSPPRDTGPSGGAMGLSVAERLLLLSCSSSSESAQETTSQLRLALTPLSHEEVCLAVETVSAKLLDRIPAGQHWGGVGSSAGSAGNEFQVAARAAQAKLRCHERLVALLLELGLLPPRSALRSDIARAQQLAQAATGFCQALQSAQQCSAAACGSLLAPAGGRSPVRARRGGAAADPLLDDSAEFPSSAHEASAAGKGGRGGGHASADYAPSLLNAAQAAALPALNRGLRAAVVARGAGDYDGRGLSAADAFFTPLSQIGEGMQMVAQVALGTLDAHAEARARNLLAAGVLNALLGAQRAARMEEPGAVMAALAGAQTAEVAFFCSASAREVLLGALLALLAAVSSGDAGSSAEVQWWRSRGGEEARSMLRTACATCVESYALEATQTVPVHPMGEDPAHGAHMEPAWRAAFRRAKRTSSALLLLLVDTESSFELATVHLDFDGLLEAVEAEPALLLPRLVDLCGRYGAVKGTEEQCLVQHVLLAYEPGPGMVRPGRLQTLLAAGKQQPAVFAAFLQTRPHLLWQHSLSLTPPAYLEAAAEALKHAACIEEAQGFAGNVHTLASIAKLAAVVGIREHTEPHDEATARGWEAALLPYDSVLVVGKARKALASLTGRPEIATLLSITELLRVALLFVQTTIDGKDSGGAADSAESAERAGAALDRVRGALGLGLELLMCAADTGDAAGLTDQAQIEIHVQVWGLALRCQEGLWGQLAAQRQGEGGPLSELEERTLRGTVFFQLLAVLKDSPVAEQTASICRMRERWDKLSPPLELLAQQEGLSGAVLFLVRATATLHV